MKNTTQYLMLFALLFLGVLFSCKKTSKPNYHFDYFGLTKGRYVIYDVVEINHDDALGMHDTAYYQLKTYWADTFVDNEGRIANEFWRYTRSTSTDAWVLKDVWTGIIDGVRAEMVEENQRMIKLLFAPTYQKVWNSNVYNMFEETETYYTDVHGDTSINGVDFDSVLVVDQFHTNSLIDTTQFMEYYAKDVGLISKKYRNLNFQIDASSGVIYLDSGIEIFYNYVEDGFE
ncbi:MAG: hypothetical protein MK066_06475 [Crocinitomicaceae bacterium]|nr:hypothetical protein [Crocinitomicaceae bacterium]